jgi:SpoVK/Ycf46/Vps4 family AAA+-type ATPase
MSNALLMLFIFILLPGHVGTPSCRMTFIFHPDHHEVTLFKDAGFTTTDMTFIKKGLEILLDTKRRPPSVSCRAKPRRQQKKEKEKEEEEMAVYPIEELKRLGVEVYQATDAAGKKKMTWDNLAGYPDVKRAVVEAVLMPLQHPEVYDRLVRFTRAQAEPNRPKAVLLEGPPGTVSEGGSGRDWEREGLAEGVDGWMGGVLP